MQQLVTTHLHSNTESQPLMGTIMHILAPYKVLKKVDTGNSFQMWTRKKCPRKVEGTWCNTDSITHWALICTNMVISTIFTTYQRGRNIYFVGLWVAFSNCTILSWQWPIRPTLILSDVWEETEEHMMIQFHSPQRVSQNKHIEQIVADLFVLTLYSSISCRQCHKIITSIIYWLIYLYLQVYCSHL